MPAKGATPEMIEAPAEEHRELSAADSVDVELVSRTFRTKRGPIQALSNMSLRATSLTKSSVDGGTPTMASAPVFSTRP